MSTRRDFLAWLLAAPTLACGSSSDGAPSGGRTPEPAGADGGTRPIDEAGEIDDVDASGCAITTRDAEGPYYEAGAPARAEIAGPDEPGVRLLVEGRLLGPDCKTPLAGYAVDVWQADANGNYYAAGDGPFRLRGKIVTDGAGRYRFSTVLPGRYGDAAGIRPAHLHVKIWTPMNEPLLTSQLYFAGDPYLGDADYCTRQGTCNSADAARVLGLADAAGGGKRARFDAVLSRT